MTTTDAQIDDPTGEFSDLAADVQQHLLTIFGTAEMMLPDERAETAQVLLGAVDLLERLNTLRLGRLILNEVGSLLVAADREERAADERNGLR